MLSIRQKEAVHCDDQAIMSVTILSQMCLVWSECYEMETIQQTTINCNQCTNIVMTWTSVVPASSFFTRHFRANYGIRRSGETFSIRRWIKVKVSLLNVLCIMSLFPVHWSQRKYLTLLMPNNHSKSECWMMWMMWMTSSRALNHNVNAKWKLEIH